LSRGEGAYRHGSTTAAFILDWADLLGQFVKLGESNVEILQAASFDTEFVSMPDTSILPIHLQ
jgi:hypothetical protein